MNLPYPTVIVIAPNRTIVKKTLDCESSDQIVNALKPFGIKEHDCGTSDCVPATNIQAVADENNNVSLTWTAPEIEAEYTYTITRNNVEIATGITQTNYTDNNVGNGLQNYCIEVVYADCTSERACTNIVGIDNEVSANSVKIFPNPATDVINISGDFANVVMFNSIGQAVKTDINNGQIDVTSLTNGVYYLMIKGSNGSRKVEKVIIAK